MDRPLWREQLPPESLDFLQKNDRLDCPFCKSLVHEPAPQNAPFLNQSSQGVGQLVRTSRVSSPDIFIACDNCLDIGRALGRGGVGVAELGVVGLLLYTSPSLNCLLEYWDDISCWLR